MNHKSDPAGHEHRQNQSQKKRRDFLKKAAYSAPTLLILGQLAKPERARADSSVSGPPDDWNPWQGG